MTTKDTNWLQQPNISGTKLMVVALVWIFLLIILEHSRLIEEISSKITEPANFMIREKLGKSPQLDPKIKVFGFDDKTISWMKGTDLNLPQWTKLLTAIDAQKPKVIIIDKMFSLLSTDGLTNEEVSFHIGQLSNLQTPIIIGAFIAPSAIKFRPPLMLDDNLYHLDTWQSGTERVQTAREFSGYSANISYARSPYVYGPDPMLRKAIKKIGHLLYEGDGKAHPLLKVDDSHVLPHFMILAADEHYLSNGSLFLNGTKVPQFLDGKVLLNFSSYSYFLKKTRPMIKNLERISRNEAFEGVAEGDYVYIIPEFYTGSTDFKLTPFGPMPGGYAHLALLNSIITGSWLRPVWGAEFIILLACVLGVILSMNFQSIGVAIGLILGSLGWTATCFAIFSYKGILIPWLTPMLGFVLCTLSLFFEKSRISEQKAQFIRNTLDGFVSPSALEKIMYNPQKVNFEARERVVTIMFIDVVSFSLLAKNQLPRIAFDNLKEVLTNIANVVHNYGGVVNKNLGDGLLCFFGYSLENDEIILDHAAQAIRCAAEIQKFNLPRTLMAYEKGDPVYPLRIGINTCSAFLGNLGSETKVDFTVIGNGVNFAKRLEGSCKPHLIMFSKTTKDLLDAAEFPLGSLVRQDIKIKHHDELIESYSYDPFKESPELLKMAFDAHDISITKVKRQDRMENQSQQKKIITTSVGPAQLLDISSRNITILLPTALFKGSKIELNLDTLSDDQRLILEKNNIGTILSEVVWSYEEQEGSIHEIRILDLTEAQKQLLVDILSQSLIFDAKEKAG